jgi:uncharacterized protein YbgA (DUF1722 family)/uncharacterized protein YbbK (DUF523 family)
MRIMEKIRLGISACLLGEKVRYDGGHKLDRFLTDTLGRYAEYVPVCPEVECGMGVPRESMRLEGAAESPRLVTVWTGRDLTGQMLDWAKGRVRELEGEGLCGFIFKSGSPSSGMERVRVYDADKVPRKIGTGLFASVFMKHFPLLPVEDDGRLHDPMVRENFIERIFVLKRFREMIRPGRELNQLIDFHSRHKMLIMAHSTKHLTLMGKLAAGAQGEDPGRVFEQYEKLLMEALKLKATVKKNTNVLQHMTGYFKKQLSSFEKKELIEVIAHYHGEDIPLVVPVTLIRHYVNKYGQEYLKGQYYLSPHPLELRLRNHV